MSIFNTQNPLILAITVFILFLGMHTLGNTIEGHAESIRTKRSNETNHVNDTPIIHGLDPFYVEPGIFFKNSYLDQKDLGVLAQLTDVSLNSGHL